MGDDRGWVRSTWPLHWRELRMLLIGYAVIVAGGIGVGLMLTGPLEHSAVTRLDARISNWLVTHRTPTWNHLTVVGSDLAETIPKIVVTLVAAGIFLAVWKRWLEALVVSVALILEASSFIIITVVVGRPRPAVPRLETSPVGSSFPSGHVAAAMAYIALTVVLFWHTRNMWMRTLAVVVVALIPPIAGISRMYRGMHFLTDVIGGALVGGAAVWLTVSVFQPHRSDVGTSAGPSDVPEVPVTATPEFVRSSDERAVG